MGVAADTDEVATGGMDGRDARSADTDEVDTETVIIGASAAGLATAAMLQRAGRPFRILEQASVVGAPWRSHYDRLHLHTPKSASGLPGLPMPADWPRYPGRDQVVEYLEIYRQHHCLEPAFGQRVRLLEQSGRSWLAHTDDRTWRARNVVIATGATRRPVLPSWPGMDGYAGTIVHSSRYRNGAPWRGRPVLVVGFGNSACEQLIDLAEHDARPHLSVRSPVNVLPRDIAGVPVLRVALALRGLPPTWADRLSRPLLRWVVGDIGRVGLRRLPYGPMVQIARDHRIPLLDIGTLDLLRTGRAQAHGGLERFTADGVMFTDGATLRADAVVLATGYRPAIEDFLPDWRAVCDDRGRPLISGSPTALPGLFFCGQRVTATGMLREIGLEARRLAQHLTAGRAG